ncbi:MAG: serine hydrolase domain-containing protein [Gemmatimonadota bacterium]
MTLNTAVHGTKGVGTWRVGRTPAWVALLATIACDSTPPPVEGAGPTNPEVDQVFSDLNRTDGPGAAVGVLLNGEVVHRAGYGVANMDHGIPITPQTVFDIASISKQFGAMAALLLAEEGRLDLDADVRTYVPELPDFGTTITPRHLIHHTSGIRDWPHAMLLGGVSYTDVISFEKILRMLHQQEDLDFDPGDEYSYSNTGYNLLARIIEVQSGMSFREYTEARIFEPLGMERSHFSDDYLEIVPGRAESYAPSDGGYVRVINQLTALASSSLNTTIDDFLVWMRNYEDRSVGGELVERMLDRGVLDDGEEIGYAHGLTTGEYRGVPTFGHGGSWAGFRTSFQRFPDQNLSIVVFCNVSNCNPAGRAREVAEVFIGDDFEPESQPGPAAERVPALELAPSALRVYEGSYRSPELDSTYDLVVEDGTLVARHWRNDDAELTPYGDDLFRGDTQWFPEVRFTRAADGSVDGFLVTGSRVRNLRFDRR